MRLPEITPEDAARTIGQHIRKLRDEVFTETQGEFARRLSVNAVTLSNYERDQQLPKMSILRGLAELAEEKRYFAGSVAFNQSARHRPETPREKVVLRIPEVKLEEIMERLKTAQTAWGKAHPRPTRYRKTTGNLGKAPCALLAATLTGP